MIISFRNNRGLTLIEMLVVLFVLSTITSIAIILSTNFIKEKEIEQFFRQLQLDIQRVQGIAIEQNTPTVFVLDGGNIYYAYFENGGKRILERVYPTGVSIKQLSTLKRVKFNAIGEVHSFGTLRFHTPLDEKKIVVNMQKGRLRFIE